MHVVKHINKDENDRVEFLFVDFDYFDGNDLSAKILHEKYRMRIGEKIDGMFYAIIPLYDENHEFKLVWHEDVGNYMYCENQDKASIARMNEVVEILANELNEKLEVK